MCKDSLLTLISIEGKTEQNCSKMCKGSLLTLTYIQGTTEQICSKIAHSCNNRSGVGVEIN